MIEQFLELIEGRKVVAFTGAGASQESGIPTFRGKGGLWEKYDPAIYATMPYTFHTFLENPQAIASFIKDFYEVLLKAEPNATHYALARFEEEGLLIGTITQNIDNLHQFAGAGNISELHGNSYRFFCRRCQAEFSYSKERLRRFIDKLTGIKLSRKQLIKHIFSFMGRCKCKKSLIPSVLFFGQGLPVKELEKAYRFIEEGEVLLCIGTSGVVVPAASLPFYAKERGCTIIEINPELTEISSIADLRITKPSSIFFSRVLEYLG